MENIFLGPQASPGAQPETAVKPRTEARKRIPLSLPRQKLQVEENAIPGYHLHWPLESNVPAFLQAGYEFVDDREVVVNTTSSYVGGDSSLSGNMDLGSRVRQIAGKDEQGRTEFHVLMKIREEYFREDQKLLEQRNASALSAIFRGEEIASKHGDDTAQRYIDPARTTNPQTLFQKHRKKAL